MSWKRVRAGALIYLVIWGASLAILIWLVGQVALVNAVWDCNQGTFGPEPAHEASEPSDPPCDVFMGFYLVQALFLLMGLGVVAAALSLIPWAILVLFFIDVLLPWLRERGKPNASAGSA